MLDCVVEQGNSQCVSCVDRKAEAREEFCLGPAVGMVDCKQVAGQLGI